MTQRLRLGIATRNALIELARQDPYAAPGYLWKNPRNPRSTGRRWTPRTLEFFEYCQQYERQNLEELAAEGSTGVSGIADTNHGVDFIH